MSIPTWVKAENGVIKEAVQGDGVVVPQGYVKVEATFYVERGDTVVNGVAVQGTRTPATTVTLESLNAKIDKLSKAVKALQD